MKNVLNHSRLRPLLLVALVFLITSLIIFLMGEKPLNVLKILFMSAFGSAENISYTLFYSTPLILTGTSVALALSAGLFNIGAEGQLYMGALFAITWGILTKDFFPAPLAWLGGILFSFFGGGLWGGVAAYLKTKRNTHEVIATIMLNFVAMALVNWVVLNVFKNTENQSLETIGIAESVRISKLWLQTSPALPAVIAVSALVMWMVSRTWWGFRVRATGLNPVASELSGISTAKTTFLAMVVAGGIAGLVGFVEVYCNSYRLLDSFSSGYGFTGVAIALLCRGNFSKLIIAALLFGALHKGALDLDLETDKITRDLSTVIQAFILVVLAVLSAPRSVEKK